MPEEKYDSRIDTMAHKLEVSKTIGKICAELTKRGDEHDNSKLGPVEKPIFDTVTPELKGLTYGSDEYKISLKRMGKALDHHYAHNRHHPEYYEFNDSLMDDRCGPIASMDLIDVIELFADWLSATKRHTDGDIMKSIQINKERFDMSLELTNIFTNTAKRMGGI